MSGSDSTHDTLWQDLKSLPSQYWIVFGGTLINRFGNFVMPFLTLYLRHERQVGNGDYPEWKIGLVLSIYGAGSLIAGLIGGYLTDKIGRKPVVMISCFGSAAFMLLLSQAHGFLALSTCIFCMALLAALYNPAVGALIADLVPPALRTRAYACQRLAVNAGFAAGMAAAGFMVRFGFAPLFIGDALTTLAMGIIAWFGLKNVQLPRSERQGWLPAISHMRGNVPFLLAVAASFLIALTFTQIGSCFSLQATGQAHMDEHAYGYLLALNGLLVVLFELPLTSVTRRFSPCRMMAIGYAVVGLGLGINLLGASVPVLVASMIILTLGEICSFPVSNSYLAALSPDDMRGRYQGVMAMTWSAATLVGPAGGLAIYQHSPAILWGLTLLLGLLAAGLILSTRVGLKRDA